MKDLTLMASIAVVSCLIGFMQQEEMMYGLGIGIGFGSVFMDILNNERKEVKGK